MYRSIFLVICLVFLTQQGYAATRTFKIAAIDWCPQICTDQQKPGYIVELITSLFEGTEFKPEITFYPWSRAIRMTNNGQVHALLAPAKSEAPQLTYPRYAVGRQQMCFFTLANNPWRFNGLSSLEGQRIGLIQDGVVGELLNYVRVNPQQFHLFPYQELFIHKSTGMLKNKRLDSFIFTLNTTRYELEQRGIWPQFKNAGCFPAVDVYMAFSPSSELVNEVSQLQLVFEQQMAMLLQQGLESSFRQRYGLD